MATAALIPVNEYLNTTYRPDRDYIDGELKERNMGEQPHSQVQAIIAGIFRENRKQWKVRVLTEQRVQTSATHYRIADVCVVRSSDPFDGIVRVPPLVCIEILSKGDTLSETQERVDDYQSMGVEHIWVVDPWKRHGYFASSRGFIQPSDGVLSLPGSPIRIVLEDIFAEMDEDKAKTS